MTTVVSVACLCVECGVFLKAFHSFKVLYIHQICHLHICNFYYNNFISPCLRFTSIDRLGVYDKNKKFALYLIEYFIMTLSLLLQNAVKKLIAPIKLFDVLLGKNDKSPGCDYFLSIKRKVF